MKFPLDLRPRPFVSRLALAAAITLSLGACATPSNRRALYFPQEGLGPWHDFARRQAVASDLGVPASSLPRPTNPTTTANPRSANAGAGSQPGTPLITPTPPETQPPAPPPTAPPSSPP
ncbi:MAG: hypothetical protein JO117_07820 [Verrucomicrobia bacterium]|nr:hypothetical protein [Verrucomicrobiota bacterium]MBV9658232.1 hypothetical protein [Verrucomicrobiota bacterium]